MTVDAVNDKQKYPYPLHDDATLVGDFVGEAERNAREPRQGCAGVDAMMFEHAYDKPKYDADVKKFSLPAPPPVKG